jgi:hypothetical protein
MKYFFFFCGAIVIIAGTYLMLHPLLFKIDEFVNTAVSVCMNFFGLVFVGIAVILDELQEIKQKINSKK